MNKKDLRIRFTRGPGAGGQHKNKVETCAVVTHIPTGLSQMCQDTRYKNRNLNIALQRLEAQLKERERLAREKARSERRREILEKAGRIRTYDFRSGKVTDHRTGTVADLKKVLDGKLHLIRK